ncbi:MAG: YlxR family protein, partial [Pseudolysinimonas sp.]
MEPVRTCLGCRQRAPRSSLLRVVARDGRAVVDTAARLPGRGAWVHPDSG